MSPYAELARHMRTVFMSGRTKELSWRKAQLLALIDMVEKELDGFCDAAYKDLRKPRHEVIGMEINLVRSEAAVAYKELDEWAAPQKVAKTLLTMSDTCYTKAEPLGLTLVIGAWNYPVQLVLLPLIGAIAAGNCCIMKPSEIAENTAKFLEAVIPKYLDKDCFAVVNGGIPETQAILKERFDLIFYTGGSTVAKVIAEAASRHLTPMVLELGGKSPCYIDDSSDIDLVSRRLIWGRFVNAGQTCIAPDYVICTKEVQDKLIPCLKKNLKLFYGDDPQKSDSYARIVNKRHFERITGYLEGTTVAIGGRTDAADLYIEPTVLINCREDDDAIKNEIFGPVLPIVNCQNLQGAVDYINSKEKSLAFYIFSKNKAVINTLLDRTSAGGVTVNDTIMHVTLDTLPFGGVGYSGTGSYHGKFSFDAFSHKKAVMIRPQGMEKVNDLRYPPYTEKKTNLITWVMVKKPGSGAGGIIRGTWGFVKLVVFGLILGYVGKTLGVDKYMPKLK